MRAVLSSDPELACEQLQRLYTLLDEGREVVRGPGSEWEWHADDELWHPVGGVEAAFRRAGERADARDRQRGLHRMAKPEAGVDLDTVDSTQDACPTDGTGPAGILAPQAGVDLPVDAPETNEDALRRANALERARMWLAFTPVEMAAHTFAEAVFDLAISFAEQTQPGFAGRNAGPQAGYVQHGSGIALSTEENARPTRGALRNCLEGRWAVWRCPDGHRKAQWVGCMRLDCERCVQAVAAQRAGRIWEDCGDLAETWGVAVLTVPEDMHGKIEPHMRSRLRRAASECVEWWLKSENHDGEPGELGTTCWFHPVGSIYVCPRARAAEQRGEDWTDEPCHSVRRKRAVGETDEGTMRCPHCAGKLESIDDEKWFPHWNVMVPLVMNCDDGKARKVAHYYPKETGALDRLRRLWARTLADVLDVEVPATINVFWEYRRGPVKVRHALRYFARSFPGWSEWTTTVGGNRYGELANRRIGAFRDVITRTLGLCEKPEAVHTCSTCAKEMQFLGVTSPTSWRYVPGGVVPPDKPHEVH